MKSIIQKFKIGDFALGGTIILVSLGMLAGDFSRRAGGTAEVYVDNRLIQTIILDENGIYRFQGAKSGVVVEVKDGAARVLESGCPLQLCVKRGWARREGEMAVCLPNRFLLLLVKGGNAAEVDEVTGR